MLNWIWVKATFKWQKCYIISGFSWRTQEVTITISKIFIFMNLIYLPLSQIALLSNTILAFLSLQVSAKIIIHENVCNFMPIFKLFSTSALSQFRATIFPQWRLSSNEAWPPFMWFFCGSIKCYGGKHSVITGNNRSRRMLPTIPSIPAGRTERPAFSFTSESSWELHIL